VDFSAFSHLKFYFIQTNFMPTLETSLEIFRIG
jgi:hypothetical protein